MTDKKENNGRHDKWLVSLLVAVLGAGGGASGGTYLYLRTSGTETLQSIARPDPFTGSDARELKAEIKTLQGKVVDLEKSVGNLPPREMVTSLALLQREIELLREELERHENYHPK